MKGKKVILSSVASLAMCTSLIVGGTFAFFTTEDKTNIAVTSGTVDVVATIEEVAVYSPALIAQDGTIADDTNVAQGGVFANGGSATVKLSTLELNGMALGDKVTFNIVVTNKSTIAVKYRTLFFVNDDEGLFSGLSVTVDGSALTMTQVSTWKSLEVGVSPTVIPVEVELPTTAGNEYQGKSTELSFSVSAVQGNALTEDFEEDEIPLYTEKDLLTFVNSMQESGSNKVCLGQDIDLTAGDTRELLTFTQDTALDLGNSVLSLVDSVNQQQDFAVIVNNADVTLTIDADEGGGIYATSDKINYSVCVAVRANGGTVIINGGNFISNDNAVYIYNVGTGKVIINGGFFQTLGNEPQDLINAGGVNPSQQLNQPDCSWIVITGGTFVNYDPSNSAVTNGDKCNYVAEGYKVVAEEQANGDVWYTVVPV